jgi:hypothetical protein
MPESKSLHVDAILTNLSIQYCNEALIWPLVMPIVKVNKRSDLFFKYNKDDSYRIPNDQLGPKSLPNEIDWGVATDNYSVKGHGLGDWLAQEAIDNADNPLQPEIDTNDTLNGQLDLAQEARVANIIFSAANYPSGNKVQLSGTGQWGGAADNPIQDVLNAIEGCFIRANTFVMGADVWKKFRALPEVLDAVKSSSRYQGSSGGLATTDECKGLFEVENWIVGRSRYTSTKPGQTPTYSRLWGKHAAALFVPATPGIKTIGFGFTFCESLRTTFRDFDGKRGEKGAHYFKVAWNSDEKIVANDVGSFIQDAVA